MIRYALKCTSDHGFESWFQSAAAFDSLAAAGHVTCPVCGGSEISKTLMAPAVAQGRKATAAPAAPLSAPVDEREKALSALRAEVEAHSDYVGKGFVSEARKMHEGTVPSRAIHGEARLDEARKLIEEGVPVMPLPFVPQRKVN